MCNMLAYIYVLWNYQCNYPMTGSILYQAPTEAVLTVRLNHCVLQASLKCLLSPAYKCHALVH